jgi:hypothetical protein
VKQRLLIIANKGCILKYLIPDSWYLTADSGLALVKKALRILGSAALRKIPLFERSEFGIF